MTGDGRPTGASAASPFERYGPADLADLIAEYPLAWLSAAGPGAPASLLPLLAEPGGGNGVATLLGHMGRRNPLHAALVADPRATILFTGPHAYVSTAMVSDPGWAPTWNYAQVVIHATVRFVPDETGAAVSKLTAAMEDAAGTGWRPHMVGPRYDAMEAAIIAFRADVNVVSARFKLGQDERPDRLREILGAHPDDALRRWMRRFNSGRIQADAPQAEI